jgi:hypothetical protein
MPNVWRFRMRAGSAADHARARAFAVENNVVGAGWNLLPRSSVPDLCDNFELYLEHAQSTYPHELRSLNIAANIIGRKIEIGDYGWAYFSHTGEYWCCQITSAFQYRTGGSFDEHDIHMTRRCKWRKAGSADSVPGVIRRAFSNRFGTVGPIVTDASIAVEAAEIIFGTMMPQTNRDLFALAGPDELEDLVALYLQDQGWYVIPSTAKLSTASYEFILVHSKTGEHAGIQVKSGSEHTLRVDVAEDLDVFFVFTANEQTAVDSDNGRIQRINRADMLAFARRNWPLLPRALRTRWPLS